MRGANTYRGARRAKVKALYRDIPRGERLTRGGFPAFWRSGA